MTSYMTLGMVANMLSQLDISQDYSIIVSHMVDDGTHRVPGGIKTMIRRSQAHPTHYEDKFGPGWRSIPVIELKLSHVNLYKRLVGEIYIGEVSDIETDNQLKIYG